jgi:pimeloyl-[acyl-carrier protein] methyl ester esterase
VTVFVDVVDLHHGTKPNLSLLHGWGLNGQVWNGVRDALAPHFTLHIVDLPGHGKSVGAPVTSLDAFVDAVAHALPTHGHMMGWSLGGHTALALAAKYPQRVDKLVTVCCTPRFIAADDWPQGKRAEILADFAKRLSTNYAATIRNFLALQALSQPEMRDVIKTLYEAVHAHGAPSVESLAAALDILKVSDIRAAIPTVTQPTLVVQGDHDALTSTASAEWLANTLPNSTYCLMEHAAHAPFISHRQAFLDHALGFLRT